MSLKKKGAHLSNINKNSLLTKIDKVRYLANITNASIETKLVKTILSSEIEADCSDLVKLDRSRRDSGTSCYIKFLIVYSYKNHFCSNTESILADIFFVNR